MRTARRANIVEEEERGIALDLETRHESLLFGAVHLRDGDFLANLFRKLLPGGCQLLAMTTPLRITGRERSNRRVELHKPLPRHFTQNKLVKGVILQTHHFYTRNDFLK